MKRFKVDVEWYVELRGYDQITVEAPDEQEAIELAKDRLQVDYNDFQKIINCDREYMATELE